MLNFNNFWRFQVILHQSNGLIQNKLMDHEGSFNALGFNQQADSFMEIGFSELLLCKFDKS